MSIDFHVLQNEYHSLRKEFVPHLGEYYLRGDQTRFSEHLAQIGFRHSSNGERNKLLFFLMADEFKRLWVAGRGRRNGDPEFTHSAMGAHLVQTLGEGDRDKSSRYVLVHDHSEDVIGYIGDCLLFRRAHPQYDDELRTSVLLSTPFLQPTDLSESKNRKEKLIGMKSFYLERLAKLHMINTYGTLEAADALLADRLDQLLNLDRKPLQFIARENLPYSLLAIDVLKDKSSPLLREAIDQAVDAHTKREHFPRDEFRKGGLLWRAYWDHLQEGVQLFAKHHMAAYQYFTPAGQIVQDHFGKPI